MEVLAVESNEYVIRLRSKEIVVIVPQNPLCLSELSKMQMIYWGY